MSKPAASARLDRLLANMGYGSRREIGQMAAAGEITLDGKPVLKADGRLAITRDLPDRMKVEGRPLDPVPGMALMLHKPLGVTCSHKEAGALVYELLPPRWRMRDPALSTVGRLDKETSGLLLLTDDGDLLHRIISPRRHVPKRYLATLDRPLGGDEVQTFASGTLMLEGDDNPLLPAILEIVEDRQAFVTVTEGRYTSPPCTAIASAACTCLGIWRPAPIACSESLRSRRSSAGEVQPRHGEMMTFSRGPPCLSSARRRRPARRVCSSLCHQRVSTSSGMRIATERPGVSRSSLSMNSSNGAWISR
jgi:16S rRNA pseudouridine516 synthase